MATWEVDVKWIGKGLLMRNVAYVCRGLFEVLMASALTGCGDSSPTETEETFPEFGEVRIFGDHREVPVRFVSGDATLAGTLYLPPTGVVFPGIVINPGSSWDVRGSWEEISFFVSGVNSVVFGFDKRGFAASTGPRCPDAVDEHIDCLADDLAAAAQTLAQAPFVRSDQVGLLGSSHGGWVAPIAANRASQAVSFLIIVNGGAVSTGQEGFYDVLTGYSLCQRSAMPMPEILESLREVGPSGFDPRPSLEALTQPTLWMFGGRDFSHPALFSIEKLDEIEAVQAKDWTVVVFEEANHDMVDGGSICQETGPLADVLTPIREWLETRW